MFLKKMTDEQRYNAVLKSLGELLEAQRDTINIQEYRIEELLKKLENSMDEDGQPKRKSFFEKLKEN